MSAPWEIQPGETSLWYRRFRDFYLLVGSERRLDDAFRRHLAATTGHGDPSAFRPRRAPGSWRTAAQRYRWRERARAFDAERYRQARAAHREASMEAIRRMYGLPGPRASRAKP